MATACFCGLPLFINSLMFWLMTFFDFPFLSGTAVFLYVEAITPAEP